MATPITNNITENSAASSAAGVNVHTDTDMTFGLPSGILSIATSIGLAITELKYDAEAQYTAEAQGPDGTVAAFAVAKKNKLSGTGSGYLLDEAAFFGNDNPHFTDGSNVLFITKRGKAYNFKDFTKADFSFVGYDGITA